MVRDAASEETLRIMQNIGKKVKLIVEDFVQDNSTINPFTVSQEFEQTVADIEVASLFENVS